MVAMTSSKLALATLVVLASVAQAQQNNNNNAAPLPNISGDTSVIGATTAASTGATSATASATGSQSASATSGTALASTSASASASASSSASATSAPPASTTASGTSSANTAFPTLAGVGIPPLIVPDTSDAPFMQKSTLPEGTVFICVGAILGVLGACVLAWQALVAYSIRRSVRNAAKSSHGPDAKSIFGLGSSEPAYHSMYATSNVSLENLAKTKTAYAGGHAHSRSASKAPSSKKAPANNANLFFSPTANSNHGSARHSAHLPPGYYASGSSQPAGGALTAHFGGGGGPGPGYGRMPSMDGMSNPPSRPGSRHNLGGGNSIGVEAQQQQQQQRRSRLNPEGSTGGHGARDSVGNLETPGTQARTPSAYMEDLFSEHGYGPRERF